MYYLIGRFVIFCLYVFICFRILMDMVLNIEEMNVNIFVIYSVMEIVNFVYRYVRV